MTNKKRRIKIAKKLRKNSAISFTESIQLAKAILKKDFQAMFSMGYRLEPRIISNIGNDYGTVIGSWLIKEEIQFKMDTKDLFAIENGIW